MKQHLTMLVIVVAGVLLAGIVAKKVLKTA
jgi:hypothetical protein